MTDRPEAAKKAHLPQTAEESDRLDAPPPEEPVNQTPEAKRAIAEADERRAKREEEEKKAREKEVGGQDGPDPVRYGDWEKGGIAWDF